MKRYLVPCVFVVFLLLSALLIFDQVENKQLASSTPTVQVEIVRLCPNENLYHEVETSGTDVVIVWFPTRNYLEIVRGNQIPEIIVMDYLNEAKIDFGDFLLILDFTGCPPT